MYRNQWPKQQFIIIYFFCTGDAWLSSARGAKLFRFPEHGQLPSIKF